MISTLREGWRRLRQRFWLSLLVDAAAILLVFFAIHAWQTRDLPVDRPAPLTELRLLEEVRHQAAVVPGEAGVVYFFAPWCFYCRHSIDNLDRLVDEGKIAWASTVALSYGSEAEVTEFVRETGISLPVLLGETSTAADWSVTAFPTYYVIDANGEISSRSVGYSTWLGMWLRTLLA
jgi:thiol-disulfide isomerase/thioredoxin